MERESQIAPRQETGVLLTGATGFLGGEVLTRLLERDGERVYALVRAPDDAGAAARIDAILWSLFGDPTPWRDRVVAVAGDITRPGLGIGFARREWLAERVRAIIHCAASVSFTLGYDEAREINVAGTRRVLELGRLCSRRGGLDYLMHVSTAYVAGKHAGDFAEDDLQVNQVFRNSYECSKFEAERLVRDHAGEIPVQIVRPSIVVGDSRTGWTNTFNVVYGPLRAYSAGMLAAIPAWRTSPVDVVPVDYVADAMLALAGRPGTTYHLTAADRASTIDELIELARDYTGRRPPVVIPPPLYRATLHQVLVRRGSERRRKVLRASEALFPYFAMRVRFPNERTREALEPHGIEVSPLAGYFTRLMDFAEGASWGRELPARHEAMAPTARLRRPPPRVPAPA